MTKSKQPNPVGPPLKHGEPTVRRSIRVPESVDKGIQAKAAKSGISWTEWAVKLFKANL